MTAKLIKLLFIFTFFSGLFETIGVPTIIIRAAIELNVLCLMIILILNKTDHKIITPGIKLFFLFSLVIFISFLFFQASPLRTLLYYRFYLSPYILLVAVVQLPIKCIDIYSINRFLVKLFLLQIFVSVIKAITIGHQEAYIGTISTHEGTLSTLVPLFAICFIMSFFMIKKLSKKKYLLLIIGFLFMGWAGDKRAIWFFTPLIIALAYWGYHKFLEVNKIMFLKIIKVNIVFIVIGTCTVIIGGKYISSLNPDGIVGGSFDINYIIEYTDNYNMAKNAKFTYGRFSNTKTVIDNLLQDALINKMLGYGTDVIKGFSRGDGRIEKFGFYGPMTGLTYHLLQVGILGSLFLILFYKKLWKYVRVALKQETDTYWLAITFGTYLTFFVFVIDFFIYSRTFVNSIAVTYPFFYLVGIVIKRNLELNDKKP